MNNLTRNEGIAVGIALVAVFAVLFFGGYIFRGGPTPSAGQPNTSAAQPNAARGGSVGLLIQDVKAGTGASVKAGDIVTVDYIGSLTDGTVFDSSKSHNQPLTFTVGGGQLIKGFDDGVVGMQTGGERKITIPSELGYGAQTVGPIPANSTLIFDVTLEKIGQ